jgi:hypothetical protein
MLSLKDMLKEDLGNNSSSMEFQGLSDHNNGRTMQWKSNPTVDQATSE